MCLGTLIKQGWEIYSVFTSTHIYIDVNLFLYPYVLRGSLEYLLGLPCLIVKDNGKLKQPRKAGTIKYLESLGMKAWVTPMS